MSTLMIIGGFFGALILLTGVATIIGNFLPEKYDLAAERSFNRPPRLLFDAVRAIDNHPKWRKLVKEVHEETPGQSYRITWVKNTIDTQIEVVSEDAPDALILRGQDVNGPVQWRRNFRFEPEGERGARVRIEEEGTVTHPWFRFVMKYISGPEKVLNDLLQDLAEYAELIDPRQDD